MYVRLMKQIIDHLSQQAVREYAQIILSQRSQRPRLLLPKDVYFEPGGQDILARDIAYELLKKPQHVQVVHKNISDSYELQNKASDAIQIIVNTNLGKTPHLQALIICRAIVHVQVNTLLSGIEFQHDAIEKLINALIIKNGLGIYAINASEEFHLNDLSKTAQDQTMGLLKNTASLDKSFLAFCKQYRIDPKSFSSHLLPDAQIRLVPQNIRDQNENFVSEYQKKLSKKHFARKRNKLVLVMCVLAIIVIGYVGYSTFNRDLQPKKQEIETARFDLYECIQELETMISIVETQDIYTLRSIASKRKACEALRIQHNQLVLEYTKQ